tara:strand:- start:844 stop:1041 length:198 start_codon:yes stop_codon:yes gene_type:complete
MAKPTKYNNSMQLKLEDDLNDFIMNEQMANFQMNKTILNKSETVRNLLYQIKEIKEKQKKKKPSK